MNIALQNAVTSLIQLLLGTIPQAIPKLGISTATTYFGVLAGEDAVSDRLYCNRPPLNDFHAELQKKILDNWLDGGEPLTVDDLYGMAVGIAKDPGTAMLICHNVMRVFSRGGDNTPYWHRVKDWLEEENQNGQPNAISPSDYVVPQFDWEGEVLHTYWQQEDDGTDNPVVELKMDGDPLADRNGPTIFAKPGPYDYYDGHYFYRPAVVKQPTEGGIFPWAKRDSIFWLLFSKNERFGITDPNDWYHFFIAATVAYYAATERWDNDEAIIDSLDKSTIFTGKAIFSLIEGIQRYEGMPVESAMVMSPVRFAWLWANSLSFIEGGLYGKEVFDSLDTITYQSDVNRETFVHRDGARFGLSKITGGLSVANQNETQLWYVPKAGKLFQEMAIISLEILATEVLTQETGLSEIYEEYWINETERVNVFSFLEDYADQLTTVLTGLKTEGPMYKNMKFAPNL